VVSTSATGCLKLMNWWPMSRTGNYLNVQQNKGEIVIYQTGDGQTSLEVSLVEDTVWLDTHQIADLFLSSYRFLNT